MSLDLDKPAAALIGCGALILFTLGTYYGFDLGKKSTETKYQFKECAMKVRDSPGYSNETCCRHESVREYVLNNDAPEVEGIAKLCEQGE